MSIRLRQNQIFYKSGFRIAIYTAITSSLVAYLILFISNSSFEESLLITFLILLGTFLTCYIVSFRLQFQRIKVLERVSKNISTKRFEEIQDIRTTHNDELDYIIKHLIKSSRTVEREIQRLNRLENYRKEFIGDISHELKTPIFAIQGFIETLLNGALKDEDVNVKFLQKAMNNVNRLIFLTKDLMEISRLETGELKSEFEDVLLYDLVQEVVESLTYKAEKEEVEIVINNIDPNIQIRADKNQMRQVFINLVENAIKYNMKGARVDIGINNLEKPGKIEFFVKDTGIGIDESDLPRVTERFFRVDKSRSRERGGTGLGLAIVKHIIEAHGESLKIESAPNKGSIFSISLSKIAS